MRKFRIKIKKTKPQLSTQNNHFMNKKTKIKRLIEIVCEFNDVSIENFQSNRKLSELCDARKMCLYLLRIKLGLTFRSMSEFVNRDISSLTSSCNKSIDRYTSERIFRADVDSIYKLFLLEFPEEGK